MIVGVWLCSAVAEPTWPSFEALSLTGKRVSSSQLIGRPTLLIVTPSRDAAAATRRWLEALRQKIKPDRYRIRDVLAINLPFFMSERDALNKATEKIPEPYHDQTWLLNSTLLEQQLGIPVDSHKAAILVLNSKGKIAVQVFGPFSQERLNTVVKTLKKLDE